MITARRADVVDPTRLARWVSLAAEGDTGAYLDFYDATCDDAYRVACLFTRDPARAQDAVVATYVRAYRRAADFNATELPARTWLLTILQQQLRETSRSPTRSLLSRRGPA